MSDYRLGKLKGRFVVTWNDERGRHRWRLGAKTPAEARAEVREFARERDSLRLAKKELTVGEIWADYVAEKEAEGRPSVGRIRDAWKPLRTTFGGAVASSVTGIDARNYIKSRRLAGVSDGTIHTELGYLRAALRRAGVRADFKLPSKPRPRGRHLTSEEARALIDGAQMPHVRLFITLALGTAGRPHAILDLTWDRVDFDRGTIHLDNPARDRTAKGRATVPMPGSLVQPLRAARNAALTNHVIEWAGKPVKSIKKGIREAARRGGMVGVTPYVLRHTAAVWLAEAGRPMEEIAQFMGHTSPAVTFRTYARYSPDYLRRASDAISTRLAGSLDHKPGHDKNE